MFSSGSEHAVAPPLDSVLCVEDLPFVERRVVSERPLSPPIFVVGDRSGHLRSMLDAHRDISFAPGSGFLSDLVRSVSDNRDTLSRYGYPDQYWLRAIARFYEAMQRDHAAARGRTRWADAAPADDVDCADRLFPRCQVVSVTGDRGAVNGRGWGRSVHSRRARVAGARMLAGRYSEVRYADLRAEPEKTLRSILAFLGEAWDPAVVAQDS